MTKIHPSREALVSTEWLRDHLDDPLVRVVEVDVDTQMFEKGHVPGAVAWDWTSELNDPVRRDVASREQFEALLSRSGITPETTVVLYGDNNNWFAAFGAWLLEYYGHEHVKLLDGGRKKWFADWMPATEEPTVVEATRYRVSRVRGELRAKREDVLHAAAEGDHALVDVRSPPEFTGEVVAPEGMTETAQRGGHIPGAVNVPWGEAVRPDGTFRSPEELEDVYAAALGHEDVITYCRIGERSSHTWFTLKHVLGAENVRNYDGSWTEYGNLIDVPVHTGPEP